MPLSQKITAGITKNVLVISLVSFFNDIASEMIYPIVPIFLTSVLGAPVAIVGLIEGIAESTASLLKVFSGWYSDKFGKRKPFMTAGYALSALSKLVIALSAHWSIVLAGRFLDRFGKGVRTSARDALLSESSEERFRGRIFGFHRAVDTAGALVGPLIALWLLNSLTNNLRLVFCLAAIPALAGVICLVIFVRDTARVGGTSTRWRLRDVKLSRDFKRFLLVSTIFAMGNSSDAFLILRSQNLGFSLSGTILVYTVFNAAYALSSFPAGIVSDRIGQKRVLLWGFGLFAAIYFFFGINTKPVFLWVLFPLYGVYMAFSEGVGKAYISLLAEKEFTGTTYGIYQTLMGICSFLASLFAGLFWQFAGPGAPFYFGSIMAILAFTIFVFCTETKERRGVHN